MRRWRSRRYNLFTLHRTRRYEPVDAHPQPRSFTVLQESPAIRAASGQAHHEP
ncbi:hypothetical protein [Paenibacillus alvei]|uniref:hypothetical protein n=1 Tax=Paenibacillus alvei TaxID=44250 RepID=UPI001F29FF99|nr:hypothetical protein [Paenibacillus alvei]